MKPKRKFLLICATIASLFLLVIVILNLIFRFMDISPYQLQIAQEIEKAIKRKVSIGEAKLSFLKGLDLTLENVTIEEKENKESFITSDRFIVSFYFFPLLKKHLAIKKVQIIGPRVQIYRTHEGEINLATWIKEIIPNQFFSEIQTKMTRIPILKKLMIKKGYLIIRDTKVSKTPLETIISDFDLELGRSFMKKSIIGLIQGKIKNGDQPALFRIETEIQKMAGDITLENLPLKGSVNLSALYINQFQPYFKQFLWTEKWEGTIDLNATYEGSFAGGFKSVGDSKFKSIGSSERPVLSDPLKVHQWVIDYSLFCDKMKLDIYEFKIKLSDLILTGKSLVDFPFSKNPFISFEFQSTPFDLKFLIKNIPFFLRQSPLRVFHDRVLRGKLKFNTMKFKGNFNQLKNLHKMENFKLIKGEVSADKVDFKVGSEGLIVKKITGILKFDGAAVKLSNISGEYKNSTISKVSGVISKPFEEPVIELSARASLQLEQILPILTFKPPFLEDVWNHEKIKDVSGRANIQAHLSGNTKTPLKLRHYGNVEFKNAAFTNTDLVHRFSSINGKVRFYSQSSLVPQKDTEMTVFLQKRAKMDSDKKEKLFYFSSLSGKYGQSEVVNITGGISGILTQPAFNLKIELDLLLNEAHPILVTYLTAKNMFENLNNLSIMSGKSRVIVQMNNLSSKLNEWDVSGGLQLKDVYVSHNRFPLAFSKLKGNIFFKKKELEWKGIYGLIGKSTFNMNGKTLDYTSKNPQIDLQINGDAHLNEIFTVLPLPEKENYFFDGITRFKLNLNGNYHAMTTSGELDLTQSSYHYKKWIKKKNGQKNTAKWNGLIERLSNFYIEEFEATYKENKIWGDVAVSGLIIKPYLNIRITTADFELADAVKLAAFLNNKSISGKLSTSFNAKGNLRGEKPLEISGKAVLNNGSYKFEFSPNIYRNINAKINFSNQKIAIKNAFLSIGNSDANIKGEIINFDKPVFALKLKSKNLDLNQLLPHEIKSIKEIISFLKKSPVFLSTRGKIHIDAERGKYSFLKFPHITGEIQLNNGRIIFNQMKTFFDKKYVSTNALMDFLSGHGLDFSLKLQGKSFEANKFESVFEQYFKNGINGRLSLASHLSGRGSNLEQIIQSLSGNLSLLLRKGDYNKQNLITGIKQILGFETKKTESDFPKTPSKEFDLIKGNFTINNGVAITENYVIETPERRTSVIGSLDLRNKKLDLSVGVAPWQNLNKTMAKIPVVGTILTGGDDKSLLINYYNVKGEMGSPEVKAVPLKSLGKKVMSLFKGIFQTPKDIFAPAK